MDAIFNPFDPDRNGLIKYDEFLRELMGEMSDRRK
jgi:Ca2+-binding EF-hand superfamily protein